MVRTDYHDQSFDAFAYNKNGDLAEAENQHVKLRLERDKTGQIIREWQDYDWVAKEYDESGSCTRITSRFGANIRMERNEMGQVISLPLSGIKRGSGRHKWTTTHWGRKQDVWFPEKYAANLEQLPWMAN